MILDISNPAQPLLVGRSSLMRRDLHPVFGRSLFKSGLVFSAQAELGLVVRALPGVLAVLQPPEAEGVLAGNPAELSVGAYSSTPVQYQWFSGATGDTSNPVAGATGRTLALPPVWESSSYWVRIQNQSGQFDSQAVAIRPVPPMDFKPLAGDLPLDGAAQGFALGQTNAYLVAGDTFHVIDISNPAQPAELSQLSLAVGSAGLVVSEPYACVWTQNGTLQRIDVSDPSHPRLAGAYSIPGATIAQVAVSAPSPTNSRAYLAGYTAEAATPGVLAVDLSDPSQIKPLGSFQDSFATVDDVGVTGHYALAVAGGVLKIIDFADPAQPQVVSSYSAEYGPPIGIFRVLVSGHYALLNLGDSVIGPSFIPGLEILDISDPVNPRRVSSAHIFGSLIGTDGTHALLDNEGTLQIVDFADPATPVLVGSFALARGNAVVRGNNLFVIDDSRFRSLELLPRLRVGVPSLGSAMLSLRWTGAAGVVLQQTHSLATPAWLDVGGTDGRSRIDLPRSFEPSFFRAVRR
jgi:hypothetical protein